MQITQNQETVKQLRKIALQHEGNETVEEMAVLYQQTRDGSLLAKCFVQNVPFFNVIVSKYEYFFSADDVVSFALEEMDKTLIDFDPARGTKVLTLFTKYFSRRLYAECRVNQYDKRKANHLVVPFDAVVKSQEAMFDEQPSHHLEQFMSGEEPEFEKIELLETLKREKDLTENEYKYCEIILNVTTDPKNVRDSDIAQTLSVSSAAINYIKKSLQKKLYGFNKILSVEV